MNMASVKVAVRVRPFNQREVDLNSVCIVEVDDKKTRLINHKVNANEGESRERIKDFTFDFSYWSHSDLDRHFAPQEQIYEDLGTDVVSNALQGYNACVFAYGQTGSGKTFTMMGSQTTPGLIPRICEALFSSMAEGREAGTTYKVEVSYLEIYNERVKDLLRQGAHNNTHSLRVREHPKLGPYVQDLSCHLVHQYHDIQELMRRGNSHRTTASTHMNDTSSRSHAIFTVTFIQAKLLSDTPLETRSKIHLVDLAGSERADATGATGQRLKEGAHINKSLVTLGSVISALAEQAAKATSGKNVFIPYRDSVLTWLLKDSLGGNSKTIMIATISPANVNYGETLSTLRYANRAKNIINKPTINEDPNVKLIRELREEILHLKTLIQDTHVIGPEANSEAGSIMAALSQKQAKEKELTDQWTERWSETHTILQEQKTLGLRKAGQGVVLDSERPHLVLIDDNLLTTGVTLYHLNDGITTIGSLSSQDIRLEGGEVLEEHCTIELHDGAATLESKSDAQCWVNSQFVDKSSRLTQGCVVVLGGSHMFRYNDPQEAARLRKEGNKAHLNLSRLSFLSRSATDLVRSCDNLPGMDSDIEKIHSDSSSTSRISKMSRLTETTDLCEISTQTSLHTHSQPTTPVGSHLEDCIANHALRKSSLTLPLVGEKEDSAADSNSVNSTPASDTFYTATSVLSPDPRDLTSPLSPLPLDVPHSGTEKDKDSLSKGAHGAFVDERNDIASKVPKEEDAKAYDVSHFERDDIDMCASVYKSPSASDAGCVSEAFQAHDKDVSHPGQKLLSPENNSEFEGASNTVDIAALLTSPILQVGDPLQPQRSPAVSLEATSTPIKKGGAHELRIGFQNINTNLDDEDKREYSSSYLCKVTVNEFAPELNCASSINTSRNPDTCPSEIDNNNFKSDNNNSSSGNGNMEGSKPQEHETEKNNVSRCPATSVGDNGMPSNETEASSTWYSGVERSEGSALIPPETEVERANEVLLRLRENSDNSNISITEKIRELEALKHHYSNLEDQLIHQPSATKADPQGCVGLSQGLTEDEENGQRVERPAHLPLDSTLLQEDRLALLIEREVQRRVLEEVVARESATLSSRPHHRRTYRSMSASMDPWNLGMRVLTPTEVRPYTSMSAGYDMEGETGNRLYQSATSADDLLLTPGPLQSPLSDYDMSCGICISIPSYEMRGAGSAAHWEYEVKITAGNDSWTVFRRYRRFRELHMYMCHKYGQPIEELYFPPRRLFGNFTERVVAERRGQLEVYLQQLIVLCSELEGSPLCGAAPSRTTLAYFSPFFQRGVFEASRHTTS
ncbi:kinesin-like protein Klp98A isoform X2 [Homarus americanus]|uniref:kinesin-like protein Klp98A isoform X2 n=1 Tax=Homarus americanus TaxID=6706 RepID=UPI001C482C91|nr:kinesin-like protein Klp98A isoform X2 [Homarus americanus]